MNLNDKKRCHSCNAENCKGTCRTKPSKQHEKKHRIDKDDFPNRIKPTDQEKNKGPKI